MHLIIENLNSYHNSQILEIGSRGGDKVYSNEERYISHGSMAPPENVPLSDKTVSHPTFWNHRDFNSRSLKITSLPFHCMWSIISIS